VHVDLALADAHAHLHRGDGVALALSFDLDDGVAFSVRHALSIGLIVRDAVALALGNAHADFEIGRAHV
jgi:hypothetical protein